MVQLGHPVPTTTVPVARAKVSDGKSVVVVAPTGGVEAGKFYLIGGWFGAAFATVAAGGNVALNIEQAEYESTQVFRTPAYSIGQLLYWDPVANLITNVAARATAPNRLIGRATSALTAGSAATVPLRFILDDPANELMVQAAAQANSTATDVAGIVADFNALLAKLRAAGIIAS